MTPVSKNYLRWQELVDEYRALCAKILTAESEVFVNGHHLTFERTQELEHWRRRKGELIISMGIEFEGVYLQYISLRRDKYKEKEKA